MPRKPSRKARPARRKAATKGRRLPPVPTAVTGILGPIAVVREADRMEKHGEYGYWRWHTRSVVVDASLTGVALWQTYYHELVHAALDDAGVQIGNKKVVEAICDAIATARVRERFG